MTDIILRFSDEQEDLEISPEMLETMKKCCVSVLETEGMSGKYEVSLTMADEEFIRSINNTYRKIDRVTDVLSFPLGEGGEYPEDYDNESFLLGDIVICAKRACSQAEEYGHGVIRELCFLCVHSMLHLIGYDHVNNEEEAEIMRRREKEALAAAGVGRE